MVISVKINNLMKEGMGKKKVYILFTILFCITCIGCFIWFPLNLKGFIWIGETKDGLVQHYNALMYYGRYLRSILSTGHIPLWDFSLGYGADILTTLHYYTIGDPLNLLSVFVPVQYTEYLYIFLILLRYYLAGCSFMAYCRFMKKRDNDILVGTIIYVFCGYAMYAGIRHPYFLNPMIYLPLLCIGIEKIYQKKSPVLFMSMICISACSNFYFFYMLVIMCVFYAIIRFFHYYHDHYFYSIMSSLIRFIRYGLIGILMSCIILVPVLILFFNTSRSQTQVYIPYLYNLDYYIKLLFESTTVVSIPYWSIQAFSSLTVISVLVMFVDTTQKLSLKISWLILTIGLCIPFFGSFMNGMSYVTNRWIFAYAFCNAYIVVCGLSCISSLKLNQIFIICLGVIVYLVLGYCFEETHNIAHHISNIFLIIFLLIIICYVSRNMFQSINKIMLGVVILNVCVNAYLRYDSNMMHYTDEFQYLTKGYEKMFLNRYKSIRNLNDTSFYRVDETNYGYLWQRNASLQSNQSSLSFFYSLGSGYISEYLSDMENVNTLSSSYTGVNYRTFLSTLASNKYFICEKNKKGAVPYGYQKIESSSKDFDIYENQYFLPIGYTYSSSLKQSTYDSLSSLEKQEALLQSVLIENPQVQYKQNNIESSLKKINTTIEENTMLQNQTIQVNQAKQRLRFTLNDNISGELYVKINGLHYDRGAQTTLTKTDIKVIYGNNSRNITVRTPYNSYYSGEENYTLNLGYMKNQPQEIYLEFKNTGEYTFKNIELYVQPMLKYSQYIQSLSKDKLENVNISLNEVSGHVSVNQNKFLLLSIPYSCGWKAFVDGQQVKLYRANVMYMGVDLSPGNHDVVLTYTTPGLKIGVILSILGWISFGYIIYFDKKGYIE